MDSFICQMCGISFDPDPDAMITLSVSEYLIKHNETFLEKDILQWEGGFMLGSKPLSDFLVKENLQIIAVPVPDEFGNNAICACQKCRVRFSDDS